MLRVRGDEGISAGFCVDLERVSKLSLTAEEVKRAARGLGADLVGIGPIERWRDVPEQNNPRSIMPRARSVICVGFRVHRGAYRGVEEGTYFSAYTFSGFSDLNNVIAPVMQRGLCSLIEDHGYEAAPIMYYSHNLANGTGRPARRPDGSLKPRPDIFFNFRVSAFLCGVGEVGYSRLLLSPRFGPLLRVYFIVTECELESDPLITGLCDGCGECVRSCPANALLEDRGDDIDIPDIGRIRRCGLDDARCRLAHISGAFSPFASEEALAYARNITEGTETLTADGGPRPPVSEFNANVTSKVSYAANARDQFRSPSGLCGACARSCLAHLERAGRLELKFHHPFRD